MPKVQPSSTVRKQAQAVRNFYETKEHVRMVLWLGQKGERIDPFSHDDGRGSANLQNVGAACLLGAFYLTNNFDPLRLAGVGDEDDFAKFLGFHTGMDMVTWNNKEGRTKADVINLLDSKLNEGADAS